MKWYLKLLLAVVIIALMPLILIFLFIAFVSYLFQLPKLKKEYKNSLYYKEFGLPFRVYRVNSAEYCFFNSFKKRNLPINYIRQESNGLEYFIYEDTLFLFPNFDQIDYDEERGQWQVSCDEDWNTFDQAFRDIVSKLDAGAPDLPIKLLVERKMFPEVDLNTVSIPACIFLTWSYKTAFENEDSPLKLVVPTDSNILYNMMIKTPGLRGSFEIIENESICWDLSSDIQIEIFVAPEDCYILINKKCSDESLKGITHWHPTIFEIYEDVCKIGMRGNILVLRSFMGRTDVVYMGEKENCPYLNGKRPLLGKLYLEGE